MQIPIHSSRLGFRGHFGDSALKTAKLNRIVEHFARRGAIQEQLTVAIHVVRNRSPEFCQQPQPGLGDADQPAGCIRPQQASTMAEKIPQVLQPPASGLDGSCAAASRYHQSWLVSPHCGIVF